MFAQFRCLAACKLKEEARDVLVCRGMPSFTFYEDKLYVVYDPVKEIVITQNFRDA